MDHYSYTEFNVPGKIRTMKFNFKIVTVAYVIYGKISCFF